MSKVILITQAHNSLGALIASELSGDDIIVYAGMGDRLGANLDKALEMEQYAEATDFDLRPIALDLKARETSAKAIERLFTTHGQIDVVVHTPSSGSSNLSSSLFDDFREFDDELEIAQSVRGLLFPRLCQQRNGLLVWVAGAQAEMDVVASEFAAELEVCNVETTIILPPDSSRHFSGPEQFTAPDMVDEISKDIELARAVSTIVNLPEARRPKKIDFAKAELISE